MRESLKGKAVMCVLWSAVERFSVQGIQFLLSIVIARLVLPSDYGLIAMLGVFMAIAQTFIDSGFSNALIQKQNRTNVDFSTVFYFNIVIGVFVYVCLFLGAPLIAEFYNEPQLDFIMKIVGFNLIIISFSIVQRAILTINLDFKRQAIASLVAVVISGILGIYLAYKGYGVWALVIQALLNNLLCTVFLSILTRWKPDFSFSYNSFKGLFAFGSKLLLSSVLHTIYQNLYNLVIGKKFSAVELGYYNRAYTLAYFPSSNIINVIVRAIYPIQCNIQDDTEKLEKTFIQYLRMTAYIIFPLMLMLCILAEPLVSLILTDKWLPIVPLLQILCIAYMWDPIMVINCNIINVKGRTDYLLKAEIIKKISAVLILLITIPFGIKVMCIGLVFYAFCDIFIITRYTRILISYSLTKQIRALFPIILLNIGLLLLLFFISFLPLGMVTMLLVSILLGSVYYVLASYLFNYKEIILIKTTLSSFK